jgi:hypothetical protein
MSDPYLPAEMLDHVVDHLHDTRDTLRNCCLVSRSWIPRTRKHLFANVRLPTKERLQSWKETFPDPSTSPACYVKTLYINYSQVATAADADAGGWVRGFSRVEHLEVVSPGHSFPGRSSYLVPFCGLSPVVKSLHMVIPALPPWQICNLIFSFPLLEDLSVFVHEPSAANSSDSERDEMQTASHPSNPPTFTGSLELYLERGMEPIVRRLLSPPGRIHFRKLTLTLLYEEDLPWIMALVEECSHTLESLEITGDLSMCILHLCSRR